MCICRPYLSRLTITRYSKELKDFKQNLGGASVKVYRKLTDGTPCTKFCLEITRTTLKYGRETITEHIKAHLKDFNLNTDHSKENVRTKKELTYPKKGLLNPP